MFAEFFQNFRKKKDNSKNIAKKRLQFAIIYDKLEVSDDILQNLHKDILEAISKYFIIDQESLKIDIKPTEDSSSLIVNTHIVRAVKRFKPQKKKTAK